MLLAGREKLHHGATHHCWAYRVGEFSSLIERSSDAGEPSGTAGRPILDAIRRSGLMRVLVVVTRWFGGTKLGKGGLIRAYGGCAAETLNLVRTTVIIPMTDLTVVCPYDTIGWVERWVQSLGGAIEGGDYSEQAVLTLKLPVEAECAFLNAVRDDGGGRVEVKSQSLKVSRS